MGASASAPAISWAIGVRGMDTSLSSGSLDRLGIKAGEPVVRVVGLLQQVVAVPAVRRPELVLRVESGRVERLASAEPGDLPLDRTVVERLLLAAREVHTTPEPDVHIGRCRVECI